MAESAGQPLPYPRLKELGPDTGEKFLYEYRSTWLKSSAKPRTSSLGRKSCKTTNAVPVPSMPPTASKLLVQALQDVEGHLRRQGGHGSQGAFPL